MRVLEQRIRIEYNVPMPKRPDVLIVGGGVIGLTTAYFLATRAGAKVAVFDRGRFGQEASWAGAGIIPPGKPATARSSFEWLRAISGSMIANLSDELRAAVGVDNGYRECGGVELTSHEPIDTAAWTREGFEWSECTGAQLRRIEPALGPVKGPAYFVPQMAQIRNPRHLQALVAAAATRGVELRPGVPVFGFERDGRRIIALYTAEGRRCHDQYLICAGAWTDTLLASLGCRINTRPIRGQIALLRTAKPVLRRIVLMGKRYLVPRDDGRVLVGSTEEDAGFDASTTASAIGELLRFATELVPILGHAVVERCWAGLRPGNEDGLPTLGRVPGFDNLWVAAGHARMGLQLSAVTAQVMTEALAGRPSRISLDPFRPGRVPGPTVGSPFRS
jgi:glycine oxidase